MAEITCALNAIVNQSGCNDRGGLRAFYWFEVEDVDWETMLADPLQFDEATQTILGFTMVGAATMSKVTFKREEAFYDFTYTEDTDLYEQLITLMFEGKSNPRRIALQQAIACCNIGAILYANDGSQRVIGKDYNGVVFDDVLKRLRVARHLDSSGQLSNSRSRDELDLAGKSFYAPLFANVDEADLPLV